MGVGMIYRLSLRIARLLTNVSLANLATPGKVLANLARYADTGSDRGQHMRTFLVVMDETAEARQALRFAAKRAANTGASVHIIAIVQPQNFNAFGAVQATIEQEARDRAEVIANGAAGALINESGKLPTITVKVGEGQAIIRDYLNENSDVAALVLGAATDGGPGPLVSHFAANAGSLPCPLYIVPGSFTDDDIDNLT
ncbi:universal stress protein [Alteripontixanthobacter muriae]|uniref:universal stress protein n=1 Tax=Alteripontixanthobacter muriae TaxID=2705546 RepID=UPI002FC3B1E2